MTQSRCTGHCCEAFVLGYAPDELRDMNIDETIKDMVIYLGHTQNIDGHPKLPAPMHVYTCRHFNKETRNCAIYENRPDMCRDYPYGNSCQYTNCTLTCSKAKGKEDDTE